MDKQGRCSRLIYLGLPRDIALSLKDRLLKITLRYLVYVQELGARKHRKKTTRHKQALGKMRDGFLVRCIHRLINTRVMRASLALSGLSDVQYDRVSNKEMWSNAKVAEWRDLEMSHTMGQQSSKAGRGWWSEKTGSSKNVTKQQTFPHMSQRSMWSAAMFAAVLEDLQMVEDQVYENVFNSCMHKIQLSL